jgi:hypothetical protein
MRLNALWEVSESAPTRLATSRVDLESRLEGWIEADPTMLPGDLEIIARQLALEAGRLDLLGLDRQGRIHVIEVKRGMLTRDTVAQGLDYAACIEAMDSQELVRYLDAYLGKQGKSIAKLLDDRQASTALDPAEREVAIMVVGVGRDAGLERVSSYLANRNVDLTLVSFEAFQTADGRQILSREITEEEPSNSSVRPAARTGLQELRQKATAAGIGDAFGILVEAGLQAGLHHREYANSVMFAPPNMKYRALFTIWAQPREGKARVWVGNKVFEDFFPGLSITSVSAALGAEGWHHYDRDSAKVFADALGQLLPAK